MVQRRVAWGVLLVVAAAFLTLPEEAAAATKVKRAAMLFIGPVNDGGWNTANYEGLMQAKEKLNLDVVFSEAVQLADVESTARDFAARGYELILGNSFAFGDGMLRAAAAYPRTYFAMLTAVGKTAPNFSAYWPLINEPAFMAGALAGMMSKTGKIGAIGAQEIPTLVFQLEGFKLGAKHVRPDIKIFDVYTGSYSDVAKGKEAALAQINQGADVILHVANETGRGVIQACQEKKIYCVGSGSDQNKLAPETVLTSLMYNQGELVKMAVEDIEKGTFGNKSLKLGLAQGAVRLAPLHGLESKVPPEVRTRLEQIRQDIISGKIKVPEVTKRTQ
jgi:basic membrane protein A